MRRTRLLYVITRFIRGGAPILVLSMAKELSRRGFVCDIATAAPSGDDSDLYRDAAEAGLSMHLLPELRREASPVNDFRAFVRLSRVIRKGSYDIVHSHTSKAGILGRFAARSASRAITVHSPHGHIYERNARIPGVSERPLMRSVFHAAERIALPVTDHIVALTELERRQLVELGIARRDKSSVIHNAIDVERFSSCSRSRDAIRARLGIPPRAPVVEITGRLAAEKGHSCLIEAVRMISRAMPAVRLLVVGDGPERPRLESQCAGLGLSANVIFLGNRADVPELLSACDVFVLASTYEGFGLVLLEAMAAGKPIVATRVGGVPEVIQDGRTGTLVPCSEPEPMAAAIMELLNDPRRAAEMASNGLEYVRRNYDLPAMADKYRDLYERLLGHV
jgi:glycosyltransferase involved in cell wall biosynthesis